MDITEIAIQFFDLVNNTTWNDKTVLQSDEIQILFHTVLAAGFEPKEVVRGIIDENCCQQPDCPGTRLLNTNCPYKVIKLDGRDDVQATGWLDTMVRLVDREIKAETPKTRLLRKIIKKIAQSVPFEPIQLTIEGDYLQECPSSSEKINPRFMLDHTRDNHTLDSRIGMHKYCNSWMDRNHATATHDAIICRGCHIRILFPKEVKTYGDLRKALKF